MLPACGRPSSPLPGENEAGPLSEMSHGAQLCHTAWAGTRVTLSGVPEGCFGVSLG